MLEVHLLSSAKNKETHPVRLRIPCRSDPWKFSFLLQLLKMQVKTKVLFALWNLLWQWSITLCGWQLKLFFLVPTKLCAVFYCILFPTSSSKDVYSNLVCHDVGSSRRNLSWWKNIQTVAFLYQQDTIYLMVMVHDLFTDYLNSRLHQ